MGYKVIAIIITTAALTAFAAVYAVQEYHYTANKRRFSDMGDDEYGLDHGEQCRHPDHELS